MINDSVREELRDKISPIVKKINLERTPLIPNKIETPAPAPYKPVQQMAIPKPQIPVLEKTPEKTITMELGVKPTAPTLVEFQNKKADLPEWRMQLKNSVLKRQNRANTEAANVDFATVAPAKLVTSGANALKIETMPEPEPVFHTNPTVNNALQRIQQSRRQFLVQDEPQMEIAPVAEVEVVPAKSYPFRIAAKAGEVVPVPVLPVSFEAKPATINQAVKPRMATSLKAEKFDTNKLPPLPAKAAASFDIHTTTPEEEIVELEKTEIRLVETEEIVETEIETEEIEDLAPFAMRFNAGLFDLIIGSFISFILVTPFMVSSGSWMTPTGIVTFAATCAVVMFLYMTVSIGLYGRTFGMRIFSLEVVDIEGENYPTVHQAAVSSCLYILSMAMGGIGFLTLPFNSEKRAVHDLVSGTIVVREI